MELLKATEENIDKLIRKGLNSKSSDMVNYNYEVLEVKTIM